MKKVNLTFKIMAVYVFTICFKRNISISLYNNMEPVFFFFEKFNVIE